MNKKRQAGTYQTKFTDRNLTAGIYLLIIQVDDQISQHKVVMSSQK